MSQEIRTFANFHSDISVLGELADQSSRPPLPPEAYQSFKKHKTVQTTLPYYTKPCTSKPKRKPESKIIQTSLSSFLTKRQKTDTETKNTEQEINPTVPETFKVFQNLPKLWVDLIGVQKLSSFSKLEQLVTNDYAKTKCYPPQSQIFNAFKHCDPNQVKVVILGQDPYHGESQANGLAFSVSAGIRIPPSLVNIFQEIQNEFKTTETVASVAAAASQLPNKRDGNLTRWAKQGVLLMNTTLTVRAGNPNSHQSFGWDQFTRLILQELCKTRKNLVFMLWGNNAQKAMSGIPGIQDHLILRCAHPSPLSAHSGFFGCGHFEKANSFLESHGIEKIVWI